MWWAVILCSAWTFHLVITQDFILPGDIIPAHYDIQILYNLDPSTNFIFFGVVMILFKVINPTSKIVLHSENLTISDDDISLILYYNNGKNKTYVDVTKVTTHNNNFLILHLAEKLHNYAMYSLTIPFTGNLIFNLNGAYIDAYVDKKTRDTEYAVIWSFEPMSARKAFPCFDEPMYKATFKVTIGHHKDYHALSNMPLQSSSYFNDTSCRKQIIWPWDVTKYMESYIWDRFANSVLMSTYHLVVTVSKFLPYESPTNLTKTKNNIWVRRDLIDQAHYAATVTPKLLRFYENWFGIPYHLPKLDHVAVHSFEVGGFEGWGLILYKELGILCDEKESTSRYIIAVTNLLSHEICHQWFGNLVTMKWWTELWLKEGFASFFAQLSLNVVIPDYEDEHDADEIFAVLDEHSLKSSHPITSAMEVTSPQRIGETYGTNSYTKAALLVNMMYKFLGKKVFKKAINIYLTKYSYDCTTQDDLWDVLTEEGLKYQRLPNNLTMAQIMTHWSTQSGYPLITIMRDYQSKTADIFQQRYIIENKACRTRRNDPLWWIPLSVLAESNQREETSNIMWLSDTDGVNVPYKYQHSAGNDEWILFNYDMTALCRVNYDIRNWNMLIATLTKGDYESIPTWSRAQLLMDVFAFAWTGDLDYSIALQLASYLDREHESTPISAGFGSLDTIKNLLVRTSDYRIFKEYYQRIIEKPFRNIGGLTKKTIRAKEYGIKAQEIISRLACWMELESCQDKAVELFEKWMRKKNPDQDNPIPKHLRGTVYCMGVARGTARHWHFMLERTKSTYLGSVYEARNALTCTREIWLLHQTLEMAVADISENIFRDESNYILNAIISSTEGFYVAKDFIYKNSVKVFEGFKNKQLTFLQTLLSQFTSEHELKEFIMWRDMYADKLNSSAWYIELGIEKARVNIDWYTRSRPSLMKNLKLIIEDTGVRTINLKSRNKGSKKVILKYLLCIMCILLF